MLETTPAWTFTARYTLTQCYGHVHLLPTRVVGQWFCLDRADGRALWERRFFRPNTIDEIAGDTILATETRSDGPWTASFGCYGIDLDTGALLWTSHARGWRSRLVRLLDFVPGFTNELRDVPAVVRGGECFCASGRVLDVRTGRDVGRVTSKEVKNHKRPQSDAHSLYLGSFGGVFSRIRVGQGKWLSHKASPDEGAAGGFRLYLLGDDGGVAWRFDLASTGYHIAGNYYSYRYAAPHVYLVVSEEPHLRPHPTRPRYVLENPSVYHLLTVDLDRRAVAQDVRVDARKLSECRIEDVDGAGLLVSLDRRELWYYARR